MNIFLNEYKNYMATAYSFVVQAEINYEKGNFKSACKDYYHAELSYEQAKEIADKHLDISLKIKAKNYKNYCGLKIDELKKIKNIDLCNLIK